MSAEASVAEYCAAQHAVAVNSATSALHLSCLALGVGQGDLVWTTPISFVASANCAIYCGADVDFVDINPVTYNISVDDLTKKLEYADKNGRLPKVVIPVHLSGQSCDMKAIYELSQKYGFYIIEDASHAIGGSYGSTKIGSCKYSHLTVFSFHPVKIITTAEGGMILSNDHDLVKRISRLRSHGITRDPNDMSNPSHGPWYYQQVELGFNYRMTDLHAALGLSQMQRLDFFVKERHQIAHNYNSLITSSDIIKPTQDPECYSSYHLYIIRLKSGDKQFNHRQSFEKMRSAGIAVNLHYIPIYRHPFYTKMGYDYSSFPQAEAYYQEAMSLPIFPGLTYEQQVEVVNCLMSPIGYQSIF